MADRVDRGTLTAGRRWVGRRRHRLTLSECRTTVNTLQHGNVSITALKGTGRVVGRDVPSASEYVVNVLALVGCAFTPACTNAELTGRHEVGPFGYEEWLSIGGRVGRGVENTSDWVAQVVSAMRVEFTPVVTFGYQHRGEVTNASNLNVVPCAHKVSARNRTVRNESSTVAVSGTVSNTASFLFSDRTVLGRSPETEVFERVEVGGLAHGLLIPGVTCTCVVA